MSKYSEDQLRDMARQCVEAQGVNDERYFILLGMLSVATGMPMFDVSRRIAAMAA